MTSHIEREHQPRESKPNHNENANNKILLPEKQEQDKNHSDPYENHRNVVIGPSNVGKICYMSKIVEKISKKEPFLYKPDHPNNIKILKLVLKSNQ